VSDGERKTLLVAGAAAGMTTIFGTPIAAIMLAVELLRSLDPGRRHDLAAALRVLLLAAAR
jgi:H+/Cl- antiporter ClcA